MRDLQYVIFFGVTCQSDRIQVGDNGDAFE